MFRTAVATSFVAFGMMAGVASAQSNFNPPLASPTPLSQPLYLELKPGTSSNCSTLTKVTGGPQAIPEQRQQITYSVDTAPNGILLKMVDKTSGMNVGVVLDNNGKATLQPNSQLDAMPSPMREQLKQLLTDAIERGVLHKKSLNQGQAIIEGPDLEKLLGPILAAMSGPGSKVAISGGQYVTGETMSNGRRVLVTSVRLEATLPLPNNAGQMKMSGSGFGAFDVATGLQRYDTLNLKLELPAAMNMPAMNMQITNDCVIVGG